METTLRTKVGVRYILPSPNPTYRVTLGIVLCDLFFRLRCHNYSGYSLASLSLLISKTADDLFQLAGSVTAVFNCQGPLDIPIFVGSALVSRKIANLANEFPKSVAYETVINNKEAGAVAAIDRVPFSYISANFTFNTDNCVSKISYNYFQFSRCFCTVKFIMSAAGG